jgi:NTE family protein
MGLGDLFSNKPRVAFVLGGGGHFGAYEVGMLHALLEHGIKPELVVGTSIGAMNGAAVAADPSLHTVETLKRLWLNMDAEMIFGGSILSGAANLVKNRTHLHSNKALRKMIEDILPARNFEDLAVPFQCVAASIEKAAEHWFTEGPLIDAILASSAVPGVLPAIEIDGEHFLDGGIVNSVPVSRAVELGAREIYVIHVGRTDRPLEAPRTPVQVAFVAFEIARRHRLAKDMATLPEGVTAHLLPTGEPTRPNRGQLSDLRYRNFKAIEGRIERAHEATATYLSELG